MHKDTLVQPKHALFLHVSTHSPLHLPSKILSVMDTIGPTFKKLRGRTFTADTNALLTAPKDFACPPPRDHLLTRKRPSSMDDPFYEKPQKISRLEVLVQGKDVISSENSEISEAKFIKNQNLRVFKNKANHADHHITPEIPNNAAKVSEETNKSSRNDTASARLSSYNTPVCPESGPQSDTQPVEDGEDDDVTLEVLEDMHKLEECFPVLAERYRLLDKIGEGTFSTVYKAEAVDGTVLLGSQLWKSPPLQKSLASKKLKPKKKNPLVALKQIYVTSSPNRIHNELNLLFMLSGNSHVAPLLDVMRHQDQVLAILPYYQHSDFREFYRELPVKGIKKYMWELLQGLDFVHSKEIMHRDLKPTNFLYDPFKRKGVLVDFGLAEKMTPPSSSTSNNSCPCLLKDRSSISKTYSKRLNIKAAYPKVDQRPPRRANRAGTRGFRAPEVLFKCTNQSTMIDIWSAGVIGLSLFARKFPLFNSPDDIDALMELVLLFGIEKLQKCAELHGCGLEMNVPKVLTSSFNGDLIKFLCTVLEYEKENGCLPEDSVIYDTLKFLDSKSNTLVKPVLDTSAEVTDTAYDEFKKNLEEYNDVKNLFKLLHGCFSMDPSKRLSAAQLLKMPFFGELELHKDDEVLL